MIRTEITNIGDPQVLLWEGKYYCYATSSDEGFYCWSSDDLIHWSEPVMCFRAIDFWGEAQFWAPEVIAHNGKFLMHYTARSRELQSLRIGVAVADHPMGPFADVHGKPMFDCGYAALDGSVLVCEAGNFFYFARDCSENVVDGLNTSQICCARMNDDLTALVEEPTLMTTPTEPWELPKEGNFRWNEGPCVIVRDGRYIMNYSANFFASLEYSICIATADDPKGPWIKLDNNPVLSCREDLFGAGHNAFFTDRDGVLRTSFHVLTDPVHPSGDRRFMIGTVAFGERNGQLFQTIE